MYLNVGPAGAKTNDLENSWFTAASYHDWTTSGDQEENSGYVQITVADDGNVSGTRFGISNELQDDFVLTKPPSVSHFPRPDLHPSATAILRFTHPG